jgi:hypothetical protein
MCGSTFRHARYLWKIAGRIHRLGGDEHPCEDVHRNEDNRSSENHDEVQWQQRTGAHHIKVDSFDTGTMIRRGRSRHECGMTWSDRLDATRVG